MERLPTDVQTEAPVSAGQAKIQEYADRIRSGESKESIMQGLPPSFVEGIEAALAQDVPPESLAESQAASSEAAPVESLDQDAFAQWITEHLSKEEILRLDLYTLLTVRPENRLAFIADALAASESAGVLYERRVALLPELRAWSAEAESLVTQHPSGAIRGVSGTGWNHFIINESSDTAKQEDRKKAYVCLENADLLHTFTPEVMEDILAALRDHGYRGQVKFPMTGGQLYDKFDNIVLHGDTDEESERGLAIVTEVLTARALPVQFTQYGQDGIDESGKKTSHSDMLAASIRARVQSDTPSGL